MVSSSTKPLEKLFKELDTEFPAGLSTIEAAARLKVYGKNKPVDAPKIPFWRLLLDQFEDKMVQLLLLAAFLSLMISVFDNASWGNLAEPGIILLILVLNAVVGIFQERRAEEAIEALKAYSAISAVVHRNGKPQRIPAEDLVPGDIVALSVGDRVPADIQLVELNSTTFRTAESVLTGESKEVIKNVNGSTEKERYPKNMAFSGTDVVYGKALGIVLYTGVSTEIGSIQRLVELQNDVKTPLQLTLDQFGTTLSKAIGAICVVVFLTTMVHWFRLQLSEGEVSFLENFGVACIHSLKIAVALGVAAIPEGLPAVVTTCLALGTRRLSRNNALVRDLASVETLGRCRVVCCDKTGTLTTNIMSVVEVSTLNPLCEPQTYHLRKGQYQLVDDVDLVQKIPDHCEAHSGKDAAMEFPLSPLSPLKLDAALTRLSLIAVLCNEAALEYNTEKKTVKKIGSPTEAALLVMSETLAGADDAYTIQSDGSYSSSPTNDDCNVEKTLEMRVRNAKGKNDVNVPTGGSFRSFVEGFCTKEATLEFTRCRKSMSALCSCQLPRSEKSTAFSVAGCDIDFDPITHNILLVKGAPEELLSRSRSVMLSDGSHAPLTEVLRKRIDDHINTFATTKALRLIGFGYKLVSKTSANLPLSDPLRFIEVEKDLIFVGTCGMTDPPREEVAAAVAECRKAGVRILVITGDKKETAVSVCQKIGVLPSFPLSSLSNEKMFQDYVNKLVYTGAQLNAMSLQEQKKAVMSASIFCRTDPSHKMQLVQLLQDQNVICAMTGDGVNDAPALKKADIGIAMGSGSEVAKSASNMILADDNFSTIVSAIREGRRVFSNTKQFIRYLISSNIGEVVCVLFVSFFAGVPELLTPIQLLWVNFVTDGLPATALSFNPTDVEIMDQPPRPVDEPIIHSKLLFLRYTLIGCYIGISTVASYLWWFMDNGYTFDLLTNINSHQKCMNLGMKNCDVFVDPTAARGMTLSTLVMVEMFNALNAVSENNSIFVVRPSRNIWLVVAIASSVFLHLIIMYVPFFANMFEIIPLGVSKAQLEAAPLWSFVVPTQFKEWGMVLIYSFPVIIIDEALKYATRRFARNPKSGTKGRK